MYTHPCTLTSGATVTVTPWRLDEMAALATDFQAVQDTLTAALRDQPAPLPPQRTLPVLIRLLRLSLSRPDDADLVMAPDLPAVLRAIWDANGLGEHAKKALLQRLKADQRRAALLAPRTSR